MALLKSDGSFHFINNGSAQSRLVSCGEFQRSKWFVLMAIVCRVGIRVLESMRTVASVTATSPVAKVFERSRSALRRSAPFVRRLVFFFVMSVQSEGITRKACSRKLGLLRFRAR